MLWELGEYLKRKIVTTIIPALKNLFSSKKSLAGMLLVMLILQVLLSVICITGIENIISQQTVLNEYMSLIASSGVEELGSDTFSSESIETAFNSISIFIGALLIWGACAITVYQKLTFSAAERDKYVWGMYVTHGAKVRKIRSMLRYELYLPHVIATAAGYPLALALCNYAFRHHGYSYSFYWLSFLAVIVLSYISIRLVMEYQCLLIRRMSCVQMLKEEDAPKSVCFPRKHSRLVRGFTSLRYGYVTFIRMRKYYVSLAAIAAVPAVIWVCFFVSSKGEDTYLSSEINEFDVNISTGITADKLDTIESVNLSKIDGISSVSASAYYPSSRIYTHILLDRQFYSSTALTPHYTDLYADNTITLCCYDTAFRQHVGYIGTIRQGYVTIITSADRPRYNYKDGDKIWLAVSKLNGEIRAVNENDLSLLRQEVDDCEYIELKVSTVRVLSDGGLSTKGFANPDNTYFVLSPTDYKQITSIDPSIYSYEVDASDISYDATVDKKGNLNITFNRSAFGDTLPSKGNCIELNGRFSATVTLTTYRNKTNPTQQWTHSFDEKFEYLYVNSVSVTNDTVTLNVSPYAIVTVHSGLFEDDLLAFGTPELNSSNGKYFASTCYDNMTLSNTSVIIDTGIATVHTSSAVNAANAGTHALVTSDVLPSSSGRLLLQQFYADNSFILACADKRTKAALGVNAPYVGAGEAVLVLPANGAHHYALSVGDEILMAITKFDVSTYNPNAILTIPEYDMLYQLIHTKKHDYLSYTVTHVTVSDSVSKPTIFVNSTDFCSIIQKQAPYVGFDIIIDSGIDSADYARLRKEISEWASMSTVQLSVESKGAFVEYILRKNANYSTIMMLIGFLVPLIIPFIWYYPIATLFDRRRNEMLLLRAVGKKRSQIFASFAIEGSLVSLGAFLAVVLFCYPALLTFSAICAICGLPMTIDVNVLTPIVMLVAAAFSALCAAVSFAICYVTTFPKKQRAPK